MSEPSRNVLNIDFNALREIMQLGVRRAATFMAFGLHAANDENLRSAALDSSFVYHFMPEPLPDDVAIQARRDFKIWIIGSALRELDQYFTLFQDECYHIIELVAFHGQRPDLVGINKRRKPFESDTNSAKKLAKLVARLDARPDMMPIFESLSAARNAFSHNRGIVSQRHCLSKDRLTIRWLGLDAMVDGEVIPIHHEGINFSGSSTISIVASERATSFAIGEAIELNPHDLSEICLTYAIQADRIGSDLVNHMRSIGIPGTSELTKGNPNHTASE